MKNARQFLKRSLSILQIFSVCALALFSIGAMQQINATSFSESVWHKNFGPGFELQNKANPIWISVVVDNSLKGSFKLDKNRKKNIKIQPTKSLILGIFTEKPKISPKGYAFGSFVGSKPQYIYAINSPGKSKYVTWNPEKHKNMTAKYLYPQTGPYLGLSGKTDSGFSLAENISQANIQLQEASM